jgi:hypothetical protein
LTPFEQGNDENMIHDTSRWLFIISILTM